MFRAAAVAAGLAAAGCAGPLSALQPEGPAAGGIATLWWIMLWGSLAIFVAVSAVLWLACARPAMLRAAGTDALLLWGGVAMPSAVLAALVLAALVLGERLLATPRESAALRVEASARQWVWTFRYPGATSGPMPDHLVIPAGRDIDFAVTSGDVIHSFWIPRLGGKIDAIPGHENVVRLRADRPGVYGGICAEFCGDGHAAMRFTVEALDESAFEAFLAGRRTGGGGS